MSDSEVDPNEISTAESGHPRESAPSLTADAIVWPEPSPLESWWEHVVNDHATTLPEREPVTDAGK
ncbi:hypothetical protein ACFVKB_28695 [Rhodococcus sp. NPDC127530]|uniref:hypothetical protein n=1 Tax=unclassified Rhodococcus (in: high G+C Gram-positive bacteria) TaxID=192944 RepID=UPI00362DE8B6